MPESSLRAQDQMVVDWLRGLTFRNQHPKVREAHLSRQFAATHEIDEDVVPDVKQVAPFPQISAYMKGIFPDTERRLARGFMVNLGPRPRVWKPELHTSVPADPSDPRLNGVDNRAYVTTDKSEIYLIPWPLAFDMEYQIDILTKTQRDMVLLRSALLARFDNVNETYLYADIEGIGRQMIRVSLDRVDDTSDLEPSGERERTLRSTISITVHGWIYRVPVRKKTVQNAHVVVIDASGEDPIADDTLDDGSEFLAWYNDPDNYTFSADGATLLSVQESPTFTPPNRVLFWVTRDEAGNTVIGP